ncbi:unnamed protein product [Mytilus coruscus]|uniref:Uncharacterized protein n=1 Tax=Mytilus coruscus TaxID=42192 RepID=A0A6J8D486_MYTCO|nr:unnamed protein product [Mytilus coruscus]
MIHWHGLCWRFDKEPHNLMHQAFIDGKTDEECAKLLSDWAKLQYKMTANHSAVLDENERPRKNIWPPPESTAPAPPDEKILLLNYSWICAVQKCINASHSWEGYPVAIFLDDDVQLPPVLDTPVYKGNSKSPTGMHGALVWKEFDNEVLLNSVVRQAEDQNYLKNIIGALREYKLT